MATVPATVTRSQSARTRRSSVARKGESDLEPIFGVASQQKKKSDDEGEETSSKMHQLGAEFKPRRYLAKAKPKTRKCDQ